MSSAAKIERRRARAHELRAEGLSLREIAAKLGCGKSSVGEYLKQPAPSIQPVPNLQDPDGSPVAGAEEGNSRALTHGANSAALIEPRARELRPQVLGANTHLDDQRDGPAITRYALILARVERVYTWLDAQQDAVFADIDKGTIHSVYGRLERWERQAAEAERELAISPSTRTRLGLDKLRGFDLAGALMAAEAEEKKRLGAGAND